MSLSDEGDYEAALAAIEVSLELEPDSADALELRGFLLTVTCGCFNDAVSDYRAAINLEPGSSQRHLDLANAQMRSADWSGALSSLATARSLGADAALSFNLESLVLSLAGQPGDGLDAAEEATSTASESQLPFFLDTLGFAYLSAGDNEAALNTYLESLGQATTVHAVLGYGVSLWNLGFVDDARDLLAPTLAELKAGAHFQADRWLDPQLDLLVEWATEALS